MTTSVQKSPLPKSSQKNTHAAPRIYLLFFLGGGLLVLGALIFFLLPDTPELALGGAIAPAKLDLPAPELSLTDPAGNPVSLTGLRGQYVLVNNWATWCPPCKKEMPALEQYYQDKKSQSFLLVGINAGDPADWVSQFAVEYGISFPLWVDRKQVAVQAFNNFGLPSTYLIDPDGTVLMGWTGEINYATLEKYVTPLLEE